MAFSVTTIISAAFFALAYWAYKKIQKLKAYQDNTVLVDAVIIDRQVLDGKYGAYRYWLHYNFTLDQSDVTGKAEVSARLFDSMLEGNVITVMVDNDQAHKSWLQSVFLDRMSSYRALLGFSACFRYCYTIYIKRFIGIDYPAQR